MGSPQNSFFARKIKNNSTAFSSSFHKRKIRCRKVEFVSPFVKKIKGRIVSPFILKSISSQIDVCAKSLANTGKLTLFCERVKRRTHAELSRNIVVVVVSARRSHTIRIVVIVIIAGAPPSKQKPGDFHPV